MWETLRDDAPWFLATLAMIAAVVWLALFDRGPANACNEDIVFGGPVEVDYSQLRSGTYLAPKNCVDGRCDIVLMCAVAGETICECVPGTEIRPKPRDLILAPANGDRRMSP